MNLNIQMKEFLELEAFKRLRYSSAKNQLNVNSHNPIKLFLDVLIVIVIVIVIPLGCDHSWFDTRPGLTSWQCHSSMSLTNWPRQGVKLQELWQQNVWNATTLGWLLDLYNYLEKFLCISTFLYFNANMSLTCIQKFLVILIMKQVWYKNCSDVLKSDLCSNL